MRKVKGINVDSLVTTTKNGTEFSDIEVAKYVKRHLHILDRFNTVKIARATMLAFDVFLGEAKIISPKRNWKFFDKETKFVWIE